MPLHCEDSGPFSRRGQNRYDDYHMSDIDDVPNLIQELKIALIGNRELKSRLLCDEEFCGWFRNHMESCVNSFIDSDTAVQEILQGHLGGIGTEETEQTNTEQFGNGSSEPPSGSTQNQSILSSLEDAMIVLRLLLSPGDDALNPELLSEVETPSATLSACVSALLALVDNINDKIFSPTNKPGLSLRNVHTWESISPLLCDTAKTLVSFAECTSSAFSGSSSRTLWRFISGLLSHFSRADGASQALTPLVLEMFGAFSLLLELDSKSDDDCGFKSAQAFLSQTIKYLEILLDKMFSSYFQSPLDEWHLPTPAVTSAIPKIHSRFEGLDFHVASAMTIAIAQMLNMNRESDILHPNSTEHAILVSNKFRHYLLTLLHANENYILNVAALNILQYQLLKTPMLAGPTEDQTHVTFGGMLPRIIELLNHRTALVKYVPSRLRLPITILSDFCLKYPAFCVHMKNAGVDKQIMDELSNIIDSSLVFKVLQSAKNSYRTHRGVTNFSALRQQYKGFTPELFSEKSQITILADYFLLLSVFTSSNEDFRRRLTSYVAANGIHTEPNFLCLAIFEIVENYDFLSKQLVLNYDIFRKLQRTPRSESSERLTEWLSDNVGILLSLLEHSMNTNAFYLIRSLSRSVSTLRTFFVDCNSIKSSLEAVIASGREVSCAETNQQHESVLSSIKSRYDRGSNFETKGNLMSYLLEEVKRSPKLDHMVNIFTSSRRGANDKRRQSQRKLCEMKVVLLAVLSNFILDFSSFRHEIVGDEHFLKDLATLFKTTIRNKKDFDKKCDDASEAYESAREQLRVQIGILQVIKNYLYNENEENRRLIWEYIPLSLIFDLSLYGLSEAKEADKELHRLRLQQKVAAFEILRNLTAASPYFSEAIEELYLGLTAQMPRDFRRPETWHNFILRNLMSFDLFEPALRNAPATDILFMEDDEYVLRMLQESEAVKLLIAINYLEDHRYTNISTFRISEFPPKALLRVWKRILGLQFSTSHEARLCGSDANKIVKLSNSLNEIKISITWILINLTWRDDAQYSMSEESNFRRMDIIQTPENTLSDLNRGESSFFPEESLQENEVNANDMEDGLRGGSSKEILSPEFRAKLLYQAGFCEVLENIIHHLGIARPNAKGGKHASMVRFDTLNANDLYEKCKTAQSQILGLISRPDRKKDENMSSRTNGESLSLTRLSNAADLRDSHRVAGRRGSGSGHRPGGDRVPENFVETRELATQEERAQDALEDEEFDEYWIR